jgi:hypothetical protein
MNFLGLLQPMTMMTLVSLFDLCANFGFFSDGGGIPAVFQQHNFDMIIIGYVIMRLALVTQWIRVAKHDPLRKVTAYRYAIGIVLVQLGWLITNFSSIHLSPLLFLVLVICELAVPSMPKNMRSHLGTHIILWSVMAC